MKACPQCHLRYPADALYCFLDGAELSPVRDPLIGATIAGRYLIEAVIGQGGMATVYRARHKLVDRPCAIKVMNPVLAADPTIRERFRREAKSTQILAHPNVVEIFDHGDTPDGMPYMVMELLDGETLADLLSPTALPALRAVPILIQLARGIARAHDLGVVHRDLKPENVFVCRRADGTDLVKILDFGIARARHDPRLTATGELFGTPQYMAPERVNAGEAGPSVDLYALGVIFYETTTGKLPFESADTTALLVKHLKERPPPPRLIEPSVPARLDTLIMQLLEKEPRLRPVDAHRVEQDLLGVADSIGAPIPPDPEADPESSHPVSLPPVPEGVEPPPEWAARLEVFTQMLARHETPELAQNLAAMKGLLAELTQARESSALEQHKLEGIGARGREGRQRFGFAVDALGLDASRARDELRAARIDLDRLAHHSRRAAAGYTATQRDLLTWEGRSGQEQPYPQLSEAYRACAGAVDEWIAARKAEQRAQATLDDKNRVVNDLDYQIAELRGALSAHELSLDREHEKANDLLAELNARAERVEAKLLERATTFCAPLRSRPELGPLFRRLEIEAASSPLVRDAGRSS